MTADEEEARPTQILEAALAVIAERGFPETRITDVSERAGVSSALVIYYFKTKQRLLSEAMRHSEDVWYAEMQRRIEAIPSAAARLEEVVAMTCFPQSDSMPDEPFGLWLDLWTQALRDPDVRGVREEFDERFRETIRQIVRRGVADGEFKKIDVDDFAVTYSAVLDGLSIQIALADPVVDARRAFDLAMNVAASELGVTWRRRSPRRTGARRAVHA